MRLGGASAFSLSVPPGVRAEALEDYRAAFDDPAEVSFSKFDTFGVLDNSGKWWILRKAYGRTRIFPFCARLGETSYPRC